MRKAILLGFLTLLFTTVQPARAQFCPGASPWVFDDVPVGDPFCGYITWAAQNGITLGCAIIDANHRLYCPSDPVRRDQMAAFVNRLGNVRVEAVGTGPGLTGGPITGIGTINLATTQLLPTTACTNGQIARWNGSAWACSADANSGGTVTSVGSGTGLSGGPITASGTLSILTAYQLPQGCTNGQVAKSNGAGSWTCASDANSGGTVTSVTAGNGLTGGTITTSGTIAVDPTSTTLTGSFFKQGGNAFGATAVLGTTDDNAIDVRANGSRVMRYEPNSISPNVIGGSPANNVTAGVRGATIAGGGVPSGDTDPAFIDEAPNRVTDAYGTVGGGYANVAGNDDANATNRAFATVGGGAINTASGPYSIIGGGYKNVASSTYTAVGGGSQNVVTGFASVVAGGAVNIVSGGWSTIAGGISNDIGANFAFVGGGSSNQIGSSGSGSAAIGSGHVITGASSFAVGTGANISSSGSFVYCDASAGTCNSTTNNEFIAGAIGGFGFYTAKNYTTGCHIVPGGGTWSCSSSRDVKTGFADVDAPDVLAKVIALPMTTWRFVGELSGARHLGPMAQDFHAAFGLGDDDRSITTVDASGVALAAIQGLNAKLEAQIAERDAQIAELRRMVEVLMARTSPEGRLTAR